jgi:hypothetical protein
MWLTGPITTVRDEHISLNALAVARVGLTTWKWFTESRRSGAVVLGNHPITSWLVGRRSIIKTTATPQVVINIITDNVDQNASYCLKEENRPAGV